MVLYQTGNAEERRRRAAEAADQRQKDQNKRGMNGATGQLRQAHAEIPGHVEGNNLRWQMG